MINSNRNLADAYIIKAEEALESMRINKVRDWKISTAYYALYFSLYAILMRIGVKCGIHSCTLEFARSYLKNYFGDDEIDFLEDSLKARIDTQYYINRQVPDKHVEDMIKTAPEFLVKSKSIILKLNEKEINEIRKRLEDTIRNQ
jgi:uncharacterized protein (UPF0332 family)